MIGRVNYALSMRRHKRQKSRFQCEGKCTKVGIARLTATSGRTLRRPNRKVPTTVSWHRGRACRSRRIGRQVKTNAIRDWLVIEYHLTHFSVHVFPAMCADSKDHAPMTIGLLTP